MLNCRKKFIRDTDRCREEVIADRNNKPKATHEEQYKSERSNNGMGLETRPASNPKQITCQI
jgi:hypothetical protein